MVRISVVRDTLRLGDGRVLLTTSDSSARTPGSPNVLRLRMKDGAVHSVAVLPRGTRDVIYRRQAPFAPNRAELSAFTGAFYSEELDATYNVTLGDSGLVVRHRKLDAIYLAPAFTDGFTYADFGTTFIFTRDRSRKLNGFTITDGRVRGVKFVRL